MTEPSRSGAVNEESLPSSEEKESSAQPEIQESQQPLEEQIKANLSPTRSSPAQEEPSLSEEPSIIIDMGQLGDIELEPADEGFLSPLSSPLQGQRVLDRVSVHRLTPLLSQEELGEIKTIRPAGIRSLALLLLFLLCVGFLLFVFWKNSWGPIWNNPQAAFELALGLKEPPKPPAPKPAFVENEMLGQLEIRGLGIRSIKLSKGKQAIVLEGMLVNDSNRIQTGILLKASVSYSPGGLAQLSRVVPCCDSFDEEDLPKVARRSDHIHFSDDRNRATRVRLKPMDTRSFSVIFLKSSSQRLPKLYPRVQIKASEAERIQ